MVASRHDSGDWLADQEIGAQVELVPEHQRRDPQVPEWGRPVLIQLPEDHALTPGELLSIEFN